MITDVGGIRARFLKSPSSLSSSAPRRGFRLTENTKGVILELKALVEMEALMQERTR